MGLARDFAGFRAFSKLPPQRRQIVFYSESYADWPHLEPLIQALVEEHHQPIAYVCSDARDPGLHSTHPLISAFNIGSGMFRTVFFQTLACDVAVMTMPDLGVFHLKKNPATHYVYVFHAINSAHMIYPANSFDAYDTIFCVGPHHRDELLALERTRALRPRRLVDHGYGKLDSMLGAQRRLPPTEGGTHILLAPTWGKDNLVEACGEALLGSLLAEGFSVTLRPHPMTLRSPSPAYAAMLRQGEVSSTFHLDTSPSGMEALTESDLLVTDWSGIAFEFFFALGKPVLFVDVPPKVRNANYRDIDLVPIEVKLRSQMGAILALPDKSVAGARARALLADAASYPARADELREVWIFNVGDSGRAGAAAIMEARRLKT